MTREGVGLQVGRLGGAGSDYAGFLQHVGVPSFDMGFYAGGCGGSVGYYYAYTEVVCLYRDSVPISR